MDDTNNRLLSDLAGYDFNSAMLCDLLSIADNENSGVSQRYQ
jgi:hypothetical protein